MERETGREMSKRERERKIYTEINDRYLDTSINNPHTILVPGPLSLPVVSVGGRQRSNWVGISKLLGRLSLCSTLHAMGVTARSSGRTCVVEERLNR